MGTAFAGRPLGGCARGGRHGRVVAPLRDVLEGALAARLGRTPVAERRSASKRLDVKSSSSITNAPTKERCLKEEMGSDHLKFVFEDTEQLFRGNKNLYFLSTSPLDLEGY